VSQAGTGYVEATAGPVRATLVPRNGQGVGGADGLGEVQLIALSDVHRETALVSGHAPTAVLARRRWTARTRKSFTIDGEAVVLGPDGLSRFEELSRREAARTAILYAFDSIEHDVPR
jgi:hypothetical protein